MLLGVYLKLNPIGDIVFGEKTTVVVDPSEEHLKSEFHGVRRTYIPMHAVVRIDEVEKEGVATISKGDNIAPFPLQIIPRGNTQQD